MEVRLQAAKLPRKTSVEHLDEAIFDSKVLDNSTIVEEIASDDEIEDENSICYTTSPPPPEWITASSEYILNLPKISQLTVLAYTFGGNKLLAWTSIDDAIDEIISDIEIMPERFASIVPVVWHALKSNILQINVTLPDHFDHGAYDVVKEMVASRSFSRDDWQKIKAFFGKNLQDIVLGAPRSTSPVLLYRGEPDMMLGNPNGDLLTTNFMSTTLSFPASLDFANIECCVKEITAPPGTPMLFVGFSSIYPEEFEVLLPVGTKMKLDKLPATYVVHWHGDCAKTVDMIMTKFQIRS